MVFGDTCGRAGTCQQCYEYVELWKKKGVEGDASEGRECEGRIGNGSGMVPLASSCCWYFLMASTPAAPASISCVKLP